MHNAPRAPPPIAQVQPPPGYTDIDKLERRINNNVERMINVNMERMIRIMTEQFFQLALSSRKSGTFPSQPEVNPKVHASSSSGNLYEPVRKVNAIVSFRSDRGVDNQVRNPNEPCRYPHQFFQNSSPSSTPDTGPSSQSGHTPDGVLNTSDSPPSPKSPSKEEKLQEKDSSGSASSSPSKSSSPLSFEKIQMPLLPFPHRLKKKRSRSY